MTCKPAQGKQNKKGIFEIFNHAAFAYDVINAKAELDVSDAELNFMLYEEVGITARDYTGFSHSPAVAAEMGWISLRSKFFRPLCTLLGLEPEDYIIRRPYK